MAVVVDGRKGLWVTDPHDTIPEAWQKQLRLTSGTDAGVVVGQFRLAGDQPHPDRPTRGEFQADSGETVEVRTDLILECGTG